MHCFLIISILNEINISGDIFRVFCLIADINSGPLFSCILSYWFCIVLLINHSIQLILISMSTLVSIKTTNYFYLLFPKVSKYPLHICLLMYLCSAFVLCGRFWSLISPIARPRIFHVSVILFIAGTEIDGHQIYVYSFC